MKRHINRNYQRLTIHLVNPEKKKHFQNTFTFNNIPSEGEARMTIRTMLQRPSETDAALSARIIKAYYNGEPFVFRTDRPDETANGWIIK
jgi:hypothetical protein